MATLAGSKITTFQKADVFPHFDAAVYSTALERTFQKNCTGIDCTNRAFCAVFIHIPRVKAAQLKSGLCGRIFQDLSAIGRTPLLCKKLLHRVHHYCALQSAPLLLCKKNAMQCTQQTAVCKCSVAVLTGVRWVVHSARWAVSDR